MSNAPWVEKYRPRSFHTLKGHSVIVNAIKNFLRNGQFPHLLFYGPQGTGKTSLAKLIVTTVHADSANLMALELNASDDRGINVVRNQIKTFAETSAPKNLLDKQVSTLTNYIISNTNKSSQEKSNHDTDITVANNLKQLKFLILDECDQMTSAAQTALRRIMESYAQNVRFILICNQIGKITIPIQSRCTLFRFSTVPDEIVYKCFDSIRKAEHLDLPDECFNTILKHSKNDLRATINILQQYSLASTKVFNKNELLEILSLPSEKIIYDVYASLFNDSLMNSYKKLYSYICTYGLLLEDILREIYIKVLKSGISNLAFLTLIPRLAEIEESLHIGINNDLLCYSLCAAFVEIKPLLK